MAEQGLLLPHGEQCYDQWYTFDANKVVSDTRLMAEQWLLLSHRGQYYGQWYTFDPNKVASHTRCRRCYHIQGSTMVSDTHLMPIKWSVTLCLLIKYILFSNSNAKINETTSRAAISAIVLDSTLTLHWRHWLPFGFSAVRWSVNY